jgi:uncharacterized protein YjbI with pentapeptide repeats
MPDDEPRSVSVFRPGSWPLAVAVIASIAAGLGLAAGLIEVFSWLAYGTWKPWDRAATVEVPDLVKLALAVVAGIGAAQALVVGYRRQRNLEQDQAGRRDQIRLMTERFGAAATQLGGAHAAVRLAGVYAMAGLADEWTDQQQQCIDVLCAYLRLPYQPVTETDLPESRSLERTVQEGAGTKRDTQTWKNSPGEREVRLTVIRVIRDHLQPVRAGDDKPRWLGRNFDFTGAVFDGGDFGGAVFSGGTVVFRDAVFSGGTVDFDDAKFCGGTVDFDDAKFCGGTVVFVGAEFSGGTVAFYDAQFSGGYVVFQRAKFSGGTVAFYGARISAGALFFGDAKFSAGTVVFVGVDFSEHVYVNFERAVFSGGTVAFDNARFSGGTVTFERAEFSGGTVAFDDARFSGGTVAFNEAVFSGGVVTKDGQDFRGWPPDV